VAVRRARESFDAFASAGAHKACIGAKAQLARYALRGGSLAEAQPYATDVWAYLQAHTPYGLYIYTGELNPFLACAEVFQATGDVGSANAAIDKGYRDLMAFVKEFTNAEWRRVYLETPPDNVALAARWRAIHPEASTG
jgi:hypothetical protein